MNLDAEQVAPIVNLVSELKEGTGGHDSKYGSLESITWSFMDRTGRDEPHIRIQVKIEHWHFWDGEQLQRLKDRVEEFADEHGNVEDRIFYLKRDKPLSFSLEIPVENDDKGENQ